MRINWFTWMQQAAMEAAMPLHRKAAAFIDPTFATPVAVEGCDITVSAGQVAITEGWVLWKHNSWTEPRLLRVLAATLNVTNEASASLKFLASVGPHTLTNRYEDGTTEAITYAATQTYADSPPGSAPLYVDEVLEPQPSNNPGGVFFTLTALRYGGAALGEVRYVDWTAQQLADAGFTGGQGRGVWAGWQVATQFAGRTLIGVGTLNGNTYNPQQTGGAATHTLTLGEMPKHTHTGAPNDTGEVSPGAPGVLWRSTSGQNVTVQGPDSTGSGNEPNVVDPPRHLPPSGNGEPHNNMQPFFATYILRKER